MDIILKLIKPGVKSVVIKDVIAYAVRDKLSITVKKNTFINRDLFSKILLRGEKYKAIELKNIAGYKVV